MSSAAVMIGALRLMLFTKGVWQWLIYYSLCCKKMPHPLFLKCKAPGAFNRINTIVINEQNINNSKSRTLINDGKGAYL